MLEVEISYAKKAEPKKPAESLPVTETVQVTVAEKTDQTSTFAASTILETTQKSNEIESSSIKLDVVESSTVQLDEFEVGPIVQ